MKRFLIPVFVVLFVALVLTEVSAEEMRDRRLLGEPVAERQEAREKLMEVVQANREEFKNIRQEKMSEVAKQVKILQEERGDGDESGIGLKVREIARNQIAAQEKISNKLEQMEQRRVWVKKMFGYNKEAVASIQEEIAANRERAQELLKLQEESTDQEEIAEIEAAIEALTEQNAYLQESIREEMQNQGFFSRFRNFFKRD